MKALSNRLRVVLALMAVSDLMVFSEMTMLGLIAMAAGTAIMLLGMTYSDRQVSVIGGLVASGTAAASIDLTTLLELRTLLTAAAGLLIPSALIAWLALTSEGAGRGDELATSRPFILASAYGVLCLLSVPLVVLAISVFSHGVSMSVTTMTEISILLVAEIAGFMIILTRGASSAAGPSVQENEEPSE